MRSGVMLAYREALRLIARLPTAAEKAAALTEARESMRSNLSAPVEKVPDLLKVLISKISFLRMRTPRQPRDSGRVGVGKFVYREGKVVQGQGRDAGSRAADGSMSMEDAWQKHRSLMDRQYFGRKAPRFSEIF